MAAEQRAGPGLQAEQGIAVVGVQASAAQAQLLQLSAHRVPQAGTQGAVHGAACGQGAASVHGEGLSPGEDTLGLDAQITPGAQPAL